MALDPNEFLDKHIKEGKERLAKEQKFYEEILNDLDSNPKYKDFFEKYHPHSVLKFKEEFARYKANSILYEDSYRKQEEEETLDYHEAAVNCLWEIQQKKLFTVQCRWRAGLINLKEVNLTSDFGAYWEKKIHTCKFIEPVTQQEIDDYKIYLEEVRDKDVFNFEQYQDFEEIAGRGWHKKEKQRMPPYYRWWYNKYGDDELHLPDKRRAREGYYRNFYREESKRKTEEHKAAPGFDAKPCIFFSEDKDFIAFINKFGEERMIEFRKLKKKIDGMYSEWNYFDEHIDLLEEAGDDWPVDANEDWRWGLIVAGIHYKQSMVAVQLQYVFDDYLFRLKNNIAPVEPDYWGMEEEDIDEMMRIWRIGISRGWELAGEKGEWHAGDEEI